MAKFPKSKEEIMILAGRVAAGIAANPAAYPNPPFDAGPLNTHIFTAIDHIAQRQTKEGELAAAVDTEDGSVGVVADDVRHLLRLAHDMYAGDDAKLALIGSGKRADPRYLPPGQVRNLEVLAQGAGDVRLKWKSPEKTQSVGAVRYYRIEREIRDLETNQITEEFGQWQDTTSKRTHTIHDQPRRVDIRYRVIANNPNGDGPPSDTESVVL